MTSMTQPVARRRVTIGVDTHKHIHVAVALDELGTALDRQRFAADAAGYRQLIDWAAGLGTRLTFAIEGTGSYGAGLTSAVRRRGIRVVEVMRADRRDRRLRGSRTPWTRRTLPAPRSPAPRPRSPRPPTARWR